MSSKVQQVDYFTNTELTPPTSAADARAPEFPVIQPLSSNLPPSPEDSDASGGRQVLIFSGIALYLVRD